MLQIMSKVNIKIALANLPLSSHSGLTINISHILFYMSSTFPGQSKVVTLQRIHMREEYVIVPEGNASEVEDEPEDEEEGCLDLINANDEEPHADQEL